MPVSLTLADDVDLRRCQHCHGHVTDHWRRTFGDPDNVAHACPRCAETRFDGIYGASNPNWTPGQYDTLTKPDGGDR